MTLIRSFPAVRVRRILSRAVSILTFDTAKKRLFAWLALTALIFFARFSWLANLSLYKRIGMEWVPSVGLTRAYWYVLHGDFSAAWAMNPLIYAVLLVGMPLLLRDVFIVLRVYSKR